MMNYIIGIDLGGSNIVAAVVDEKGSVINRLEEPTKGKQGADLVLDQLRGMILRLKNSSLDENRQILAIGLGSPGGIGSQGAVTGDALNIRGWEGTPLKSIIEKTINIPTYIDNDANVAALGESAFGAGKGIRNLICLTLGTGIGGGLIIDGKIYRGFRGSAAELGHITVEAESGERCLCGNYGCLEAYTSARAIVDMITRGIEDGVRTSVRELSKSNLKKITAQIVFEAARAGDELAKSIVNKFARYLGAGIASLLNILNPEMVIIGGGMAQSGDIFLESVREIISKRALRATAKDVRVVLAKLGKDAGVIGAAALAMQEIGMVKGEDNP